MYCEVSDVKSMIKEDMINVIIGDEYIEDEEKKQQMFQKVAMDAIADACSEIDGYLSGRYTVPFKKTPAMLNKLVKDIAVYNLVSRHGINESDREKTFLNRYNQAIKFLTAVAEGKIDIGVKDQTASVASGSGAGFHIQSPERVFSRTSMRGW